MTMLANHEGDLAAALGASEGVVCLVGAGGKKTTMYALAAIHGGRVALSSTAHMYRYDTECVDQVMTVAGEGDNRPGDGRVVAFAGPTDTAERVGGLTTEQLSAIWRSGRFTLLLIKADGARARWIKAPAAYEPLIPAFADTVIPVISARVIGRTLSSGIAHRGELVADVVGATLDEPLRPEHLARLLSSERGALQKVGDSLVVPLINMVDDEPTRRRAEAVAQAALAATTRFDRVVLASMRKRQLIDVVTR